MRLILALFSAPLKQLLHLILIEQFMFHPIYKKMMSGLLEMLLYFFVKEDLYKSPLLSCKKVV